MDAFHIIKDELNRMRGVLRNNPSQIGYLDLFVQQSAYVISINATGKYRVNFERRKEFYGMSINDMAAAIAFDMSNRAELAQDLLFVGYDTEDLPSNVIGIMMARGGIKDMGAHRVKQWLANKCGKVLTKKAALEVCDCCNFPPVKVNEPPRNSGNTIGRSVTPALADAA